MANKKIQRKVVIEPDGKHAHTESPVDIEVEETDIM
ncbi:MAG: hypothetical protein JWO35_794 [Candidatus Saccharibacteria bacterium]|nr:hypothetical protein [Candidatus Saccharibacteria bacterium]